MYDILIKNGTVVDGTKGKSFRADVAVKDNVICEIAENITGDAKRVLDAAGKIVAPGFIDIHSHSDICPFMDMVRDGKLQQGVTSEIAGNCGSSAVPFSENARSDMLKYVMTHDLSDSSKASITEYAKDVTKIGFANNIGLLVGHCALRLAVMGFVDRNPNEEEMKQLESLLERELNAGAFGMSLGLIYPPSAFSEREELVRLAKVLKRHDALLSVHMRNEGPRIFEAVEEMISIAKESGVHLEISHLKLMGKPQWGKANALLKLIETAQSEGVNINCDQYPFLASSTSLKATVPHYAQDGGEGELLKRLENASEKLKTEIAERIEERGGADTILIVSAGKHPEYKEKYLSDIMKEYNLSPEDAAIKVLLDARANVSCIYFCINENDMLSIMPKEYVSVGSDGRAYNYEALKSKPHPRNFATFPRFFQYVREKNVMPIETAVYKCTGLPAKCLGISDRGVLKKGNLADITVFDFDKIKSNSEFTDPCQKPDGIEYVIVNGKLALEHKTVIDGYAGIGLLRK